MFHKQNARQPVAAALLAVLLALATAFSCIGLSGWASFRRQVDELDAQYTTVAYSTIPERYGSTWTFADGSIQLPDGTIYLGSQQVNQLAEGAPSLLRRSANILTAAHTPNQKGFSSGAADPLDYVDVYDVNRYSQSVIAVRCLSAEEYTYQSQYEGKTYTSTLSWYTFEWIEPVCRMAAYDLPEAGKGFRFTQSFSNTLAQAPDFSQDMENAARFLNFEEGKTYLIRGDFIDFDVMNFGGRFRETPDYYERGGMSPSLAITQRIVFMYPSLNVKWNYDDSGFSSDDVGHPFTFVPNFYLEGEAELTGDDPKSFSYPPEDSWPFYAEYEGDWRDFLNTEEGQVWRDEIIPCCETSHNSVPVLLTDNVQGLSQFCKQESALLEGRFITEEEYKSGAAVCMVGADYALYNDLKVGDTLTLDLYKPAYTTNRGTLKSAYPVTFYYTGCLPLVEENRLDVTRDYTIVGLYSAPARPCDPDGHGFRGDTVLAPKASAPEVVNAAEEDKVTPLLNTLVLKNGSIEEFEAYMAENGAANRFLYYDYGYSEMKESIEAMEDNALRLAVLGGAAFLIGGLVFLLASFARMSAPARSLRLLGAGPNRVTGDMLSALLPLTAAGVALGGVLGGLLYGTVCEAVLSQTLAPDWPGLAVCAVLELLVLGAVAAVWAALMARRGLMRRKQE